jgi:wyosine [tRNA(Phe)-imidazoG37] synthetase (radical SAM superfamily)
MIASLECLIHQPRDFMGNRFVYAVISQRAGGLSIGINMNPNQICNFDCLYCEVDRSHSRVDRKLDVSAMMKELKSMLGLIQLGKLRAMPQFSHVPDELLTLKNIDLSGDGEPTHSEQFLEVVREVIQLRGIPNYPHFKLVLVTNATGLHLPQVQEGIQLFLPTDEIWAKLDAGTQEYMSYINQTRIPLQSILDNILNVARKRPVVIQSLFTNVQGNGPDQEEIDQYAQRLLELKNAGAQISLVQIYSVSRPPARAGCAHLTLKDLSAIARNVRKITSLRAEVF